MLWFEQKKIGKSHIHSNYPNYEETGHLNAIQLQFKLIMKETNQPQSTGHIAASNIISWCSIVKRAKSLATKSHHPKLINFKSYWVFPLTDLLVDVVRFRYMCFN